MSRRTRPGDAPKTFQELTSIRRRSEPPNLLASGGLGYPQSAFLRERLTNRSQTILEPRSEFNLGVTGGVDSETGEER